MEIPNRLTCLLRNLYAIQEATIRTGYGITDWFKIGKGVWQSCILSLCLFINNLYTAYINAECWLEESQAGIKIARRNINSLRYADDTTLNGRKWRETKEPLDEGERDSEKAGLNLNMNQPYLYIYPLPFEAPSHLPPHLNP